MEIIDYGISMTDKIRHLFSAIYPGQPDIMEKVCYDSARQDHLSTKVALVGQAIVGQANIFHHKALDGNANLGFHIHPSVRNQGIATALSNEAIKEASSKGMTVLYIRTHEDNFPAIAVAKKLGFCEDHSKFAEKGFRVFIKYFQRQWPTRHSSGTHTAAPA